MSEQKKNGIADKQKEISPEIAIEAPPAIQLEGGGMKPGNIFQRIADITEKIEAIGKERRNKDQGYNFRGIDQVYNMVHPLLAKNRVFCVPEVLDIDREERSTRSGGTMVTTIQTIRFRYYTDDGSYVDCILKGEGMDTGDKSTNKSITAAHKYSFLVMFSIPTSDMVDGDSESPETRENGSSSGSSDGWSYDKKLPWLNENTEEWNQAADNIQSGKWTLSDLQAKYKVNKKGQEFFEQLKVGEPEQDGLSPDQREKLIKMLSVLPKEHRYRGIDMDTVKPKKFDGMIKFLELYKELRKGLQQMKDSGNINDSGFNELAEKLRVAETMTHLSIIIDDMTITGPDGQEVAKRILEEPEAV